MDRQELVTETFNRLLERGAVARSDVDAALAAAGHAPASAEEWCHATGEPTPRERRFGAGLTVRQYALLQALFDLAPHGGLGRRGGGLDLSALNAVLARRDRGPATRGEVKAALKRSVEALEARRAENCGHLALLRAVHDLAAEVGIEPDRPVLAALDRAGFRSRRLTDGGWQPTAEERALLERVARECVAGEPDAANAARAMLRRSRDDVALREAVLSLALVTAAAEYLRDADGGAEEDEAVTPASGRLRAAAALELCRRLAPEPARPYRERFERLIRAEVERHGDEGRAVQAAIARLKADPAAAEALAGDALEEVVALEIAQFGLKEAA